MLNLTTYRNMTGFTFVPNDQFADEKYPFPHVKVFHPIGGDGVLAVWILPDSLAGASQSEWETWIDGLG